MCGIGGIIRVTPAGEARRPIDEAWLDSLDEAIAWRGPDGAGRFRDAATRSDGATVEVALVHRRLAIIDIADGAQPMVRIDQMDGGSTRTAVVFNGCIYNHRALRHELEALGHRFRSDHSDTEVLVHGWRQWNECLADHLDAMYAAAIWDGAAGRCALLRDRAGEKPLYYALLERQRTAVFASTIPGVLAVLRRSGEDTGLDAEVLADWARFGWSERLPFRAIREAMPRETLVFPSEDGGAGVGVAHRIELPHERSPGAPLDADGVDRLLRQSIDDRTDADVPLGCFLSGGVDSSLVALYAREKLGSLRTLCVRFPGAAFDESEYARAVAAAIGTEHTTIDVEPTVAADLVELIERLGLPFGDSSLLPTHWVSKAARRHVKVALSGDGGDELFCGYRRHVAALALRRLAPLLGVVPRSAWSLVPGSESAFADVARFVMTLRTFGYEATMEWREPEFEAVFPSAHARAPEGVRGLRTLDPATDDFRRYLPFDLLRKVDTASMSAPIEVRAPLLTSRMIGAALGAPISSLMPGRRRKGLLREVLRRRLPSRLVDRPKRGFAVPIGAFFRSDVGALRALLTDMLAVSRPFGPVHDVMEVNVGPLHRALEEHLEGRRDHGARLFHLLSLAIWARWLESRGC